VHRRVGSPSAGDQQGRGRQHCKVRALLHPPAAAGMGVPIAKPSPPPPHPLPTAQPVGERHDGDACGACVKRPARVRVAEHRRRRHPGRLVPGAVSIQLDVVPAGWVDRGCWQLDTHPRAAHAMTPPLHPPPSGVQDIYANMDTMLDAMFTALPALQVRGRSAAPHAPWRMPLSPPLTPCRWCCSATISPISRAGASTGTHGPLG
jgi:hypothetical protein